MPKTMLTSLLALAVLAVTGPAWAQSTDKKEIEELKREIETLRERQKDIQRQHDDLKQDVESQEEANAEVSETLEHQKTFSVYGFFDMNYRQWWLPERGVSRFVDDEHTSFVFGNLNLYFDFQPLPTWRFLTEVRFLLNPIGDIESYEISLLGTSYKTVDTTTSNPINFGEVFDYGSIEIERAQLEWTGLECLNLTLGLFLTPYGIWNVDHGSPARITATAPPQYSSYLGAFPERQLGAKLHGSFLIGSINLGYDITLTNGRGVADTLKDSNWDKAVGGRLEAGGTGAWRWKAGFSFYTGEVTEFKRIIKTAPVVEIVRKITVQYREAALSGDFQLDVGSLRLQFEILANWRNYDDEHRPPMTPLGAFNALGGLVQGGIDNFWMGGFAPDKMCWGTYLLVAYRLPLDEINLRPYAMIAWVDFDDNTPYENAINALVGINWRISGAIVFKAEYMFGYWPNKDSGDKPLILSSGDTHYMVLQMSVAF